MIRFDRAIRNNKVFRRLNLPADPLFRLLIVNGLAGLAITVLVLAGIFLTNIGNLRVLVSTSSDPFVPVVLLACGLAVTLGSVVIGSAIMLVGDTPPPAGGGGHRSRESYPASRMQPVRVPVAVRPERRTRH